LGGEGWSGEAEDFEGEGVWACGLGVGLGHVGCDDPFARRQVENFLCPDLLGLLLIPEPQFPVPVVEYMTGTPASRFPNPRSSDPQA
jgi:hypothetical protein